MQTKTFELLLPLLNTQVNLKFINTIKKVSIRGDNILLHYKFSEESMYLKYEDSLFSNPLYITCLDNGENTIYAFKFPEEFQNEVHLFKQNRVNEFSDKAKEIILMFLKTYGDKYAYRLYKYNFETNEIEKNKILKQFLITPKDLNNLNVNIKLETFDYLKDMDLSFEENTRKNLNFK